MSLRHKRYADIANVLAVNGATTSQWGLTVQEISDKTELPRASTYRLLMNMERDKYGIGLVNSKKQPTRFFVNLFAHAEAITNGPVEDTSNARPENLPRTAMDFVVLEISNAARATLSMFPDEALKKNWPVGTEVNSENAKKVLLDLALNKNDSNTTPEQKAAWLFLKAMWHLHENGKDYA